MSFVHPSYLWGLFSLFIPLAIHLWSKRDGKTLFVGSTTLLAETHSKKASSVQLNEYMLLFLRLLVLSVLVFILAEPSVTRPKETKDLVYLIEPELYKNEKTKALYDTLPVADLYYFQSGFPKIDPEKENTQEDKSSQYWQLANQLKDLPADSVVIYTKGLSKGLRGKRPKTAKNVHWIVVNPETVLDKPVKAVRIADSIQVYYASSSSEGLTFNKETYGLKNDEFTLNSSQDSIYFSNNSGLVLTELDSIRVNLVADEKYRREQHFITATLEAISFYTGWPIKIEPNPDLQNSSDNLLVWLKDEALNSEYSEPFLQYKEEPFSQELITAGTKPGNYFLTRRLNAENIISGNLGNTLVKLLNPFADLEEIIAYSDNRSVDKQMLETNKVTASENSQYIKVLAITPWLWLILFIILALERLTAYLRKQ